ncbi:MULTISPECIES: ATP-binding protein [Anaeromyxobacter]|uniref:hybrid sensor histidine kinase/response regulator n=1 Tax=Anaeromyxobacter TaxID=161492 RepID=UPI001F589D4E|nr:MULTISPECIES: ATP-binding protein [unclassified Anaeromyxobacter]
MGNDGSQLEDRVLLLMPTAHGADLAGPALRRAGLNVVSLSDTTTLASELGRGAAALVLEAEALGPDALTELSGALGLQEAWSDLPVIVLCPAGLRLPAASPAPETLEALGNVTLVERPAQVLTLLGAVKLAVRNRRRQYAARDLMRQLGRAVDARDEFLAMLGHELRNPLGAILLALPLVRASDDERPRGIIDRQARRLARLVDDLLEVSRVTRGQITLRREVVDLNEIVGEAVAGLAEAARLQGLDLAVSLWRERVPVHADSVRVEQIVANLLANALKYTPSGGRVTVLVARRNEKASIRVCDDGIGIPPEMISRIFEPFTQAATTIDRAQGGLGLGLALVKRLVDQHGGTVEARSPGPGLGSEFEVSLPIAAVTEAGERPLPRQEPRAGKLRVLVVEDNEDNRDALRLLVEHLGHEVDAVEDGLRGVARALSDHPDVMLVDIGLPGLDGYEVARRVRGALGQGVKLVAVTGYGQPEDRRRAIAAGFDQHLTKPVDYDTLFRLFKPGSWSSPVGAAAG